jgi:hypothetical protein
MDARPAWRSLGAKAPGGQFAAPASYADELNPAESTV